MFRANKEPSLIVKSERFGISHRRLVQNLPGLRVDEYQLVQRRLADHQQAVMHSHSTEVIFTFPGLRSVHFARRRSGRRVEQYRVLEHGLVAAGGEIRELGEADFELSIHAIFLVPHKGRADIGRHTRLRVAAGITRQILGSGPRAADPSAATHFFPVEVHP